MSANEQGTPESMINQYSLLSDADRSAFLSRQGRQSTAEDVIRILIALSPKEEARFSDLVFRACAQRILPVLLRGAVQLVRENPQFADTEHVEALNKLSRKCVEDLHRTIVERERVALKEKRDRHSDPATIRRYLEICNLHREDPKEWSQRNLAKKFDVTREAIRQVLKHESRWRLEALQLARKAVRAAASAK